MIEIALSKQQALDADPKAIQQINFTGNLSRKNAEDQDTNINTTTFLIIGRIERNYFRYFTKIC